MDQLAETTQPIDVIFGIEPVSPLPRREDQAMLLVKTQRLCRGPDQFCRHAHGVKRRVLVFQYVLFSDYHMISSSPSVLPWYKDRHLVREQQHAHDDQDDTAYDLDRL